MSEPTTSTVEAGWGDSAPPGTASEPALGDGFFYLAYAITVLSTVELRFRPMQGAPSFTFTEVIAYPAFVAVVVEFFTRARLARRLLEVLRSNPLVLAYVAWAVLAAIAGLVRSTTTMRALKDLVPGCTLYVLVLGTVVSYRRMAVLLTAVLIGTVPSLLLAPVQAVWGGPYLIEVHEGAEGKLGLSGDTLDQAATGLFVHPNALGVYLVPVIVFLAAWALGRLGSLRTHRVLAGGLLGMAALALLLSYAKGAYAWVVIALVMLLLPRVLERFRFAFALLLPPIGIAAIVYVAVRYLMEGIGGVGTLLDRVDLWLIASGVILDDRFTQVIGSGLDLMEMEEFSGFEYPNAHNVWLNQVLAYGIPGLLLYLAAFVRSFQILCRRARALGPTGRGLAIALLAALVALLGEYFFEPLDRGVVFTSQLFLLWGLAAALPESDARGPCESP